MSSSLHKQFLLDSEKKSFDLEHRRKIKFNISKYDDSVKKGKAQYENLDAAEVKASNIKKKVTGNIGYYLLEFEKAFTENGGKVIWAEDGEEAIDSIKEIITKRQAKLVVKSKSMATEEIELNKSLEEINVTSVETDLGEYIVQINNEKPYHIVTPAMHLSKEDIAEIFNREFNIPKESTPEEITSFVRKNLREKFITADVGITGCNFLAAEEGAVCITENEGNALLAVSFPKTHIVIAGIDKIIPSTDDLHIFWPLLATKGTGQNVTVYNSVIRGPKQKNEKDGPEEMIVILLDNKRTEILEKKNQRVSLTCIRCGACLNACPVYRNIGGHAFNTTYSGPIGSVITPVLRGMKEFGHLSYASSLCGKCTEVCPVRIPLHKLLLENRYESVKNGHVKGFEKISMTGAKIVLRNRKMMNAGGSKIKNFLIRKFLSRSWGVRRQIPEIKNKSFNKIWREKNKN